MNWHLITGEYPPQPGGVSDYTCLVAHALAEAGNSVTVWCPPADGPAPRNKNVTVRRELGRFQHRDLDRVGMMLDAESRPRRLLVQWVPHAFGRRALNYTFCHWLKKRSTHKGDNVNLLVHEAFVDFQGSLKQRIAGIIQRLMMRTLLSAADRIWVTIPAWSELIRPYAPLGSSIEWLPVPSTIPPSADPDAVATVRAACAGAAKYLIGHFGTYGPHVVSQLRPLVERLPSVVPNAKLLLLGRGGNQFRDSICRTDVGMAETLIAPGGQPAAELSAHIAACDLFVQPYAGGISSRNTSLMACLAHGRPVVATSGRLTESLWAEFGAVTLVPEHDVQALSDAIARLLGDETVRATMSTKAENLYRKRFDIDRLIQCLSKQPSRSIESCASR